MAAAAAAATEAAVAIIPRTTEARPAAGAPSYDEGMNVQPRMVLLVEDEETITVPLTEALAREGFRTETAGTLAAGLEIARRQRPDLVLLDVMLPDGTGFDLLRQLRDSERMPVIMLTARGDEADRVLGLELGATTTSSSRSARASSSPASAPSCAARAPQRLPRRPVRSRSARSRSTRRRAR